jgi:hypothetical protein
MMPRKPMTDTEIIQEICNAIDDNGGPTSPGPALDQIRERIHKSTDGANRDDAKDNL